MPRTDALVLAVSIGWIEAAMLIFMAVFIAIVVWVLLVRRGGFNAESRIPLEDNRVMTPRDPDRTDAPRTDAARDGDQEDPHA